MDDLKLMFLHSVQNGCGIGIADLAALHFFFLIYGKSLVLVMAPSVRELTASPHISVRRLSLAEFPLADRDRQRSMTASSADTVGVVLHRQCGTVRDQMSRHKVLCRTGKRHARKISK